MKTIHLTMFQAVRLVLMLDAHTGQRKDLRIVRDVRMRVGISDARLAELVTPIEGGLQLSPDIMNQPPIQLEIVPEEARRILEILDKQTMTVRDLEWAESLARQLTAAQDS